MRVTGDAEWERWQEDFRAMEEPPEAVALRRHVRRHGRLLRLLLGLEIAVAVASVAGPLAWIAVAPAPWKWVWAAILWGFAAVSILFAVINRRGTWGPADRSLTAQLDLTELRCRRQRRTLRFLLLLVPCEAAAVLAILAWVKPGSMIKAGAVLAGVALATAIGSVILYRQTRRRLAQVAAIRRDLASAADADAGPAPGIL